jgi:uncharacterized membrane protein YfcA
MDINTLDAALIGILILVAALLYSSVGHGGASAYLAVMALFGIAPEVMRPTALTLNVLVSSIAFYRYYRAGYFSWSHLWPFALASVPLAFIGGRMVLPAEYYRPLVGAVLLYAAYRLYRSTLNSAEPAERRFPLPLALLSGAGIGLLSGLTGVGGGIFLSPLLLLMGWAGVRQTAGISAAFILVNSIAGLLGRLSDVPYLPPAIPLWAIAAVAGGLIGAEYGSRRWSPATLRRLLALVLLVAGLKMLFS